MKFHTKDGVLYEKDAFGVIHQLNPRPFTYDATYAATYDTPEYVRGNQLLQAIRYSFIVGAFGAVPHSILDNGYGNGAFMKAAKEYGVKHILGYDVTGLEIPGCNIVEKRIETEVWTFHDCLEHIPDLMFLEEAPPQMIVVSLPWCIWPDSAEWFSGWKHRKPDEHLHHFNDYSLTKFMASVGWRMIAKGNHEDIIRTCPDNQPANILTMAFRRV